MTDNNELSQRVEKLEDLLRQHLQEGAVRNAHIQSLSGAVNRLEHTVYGNGKEGLTSLMARTDQKLADLASEVAELPASLKESIEGALAGALMKMKMDKSEEEKSTPADKTWKWMSDRVLPYFITGLFVIILQALWELTKMKLNAP